MKVIKASTPGELQNIFALRYRVLRAPWNQPYETSYDSLENSSVNLYINDDNGGIVACGRLQENENKVGQIRYMAVDESIRGAGYGKILLQALEKEAADLGLRKIELQARENAVRFYERNGYLIKEKTFLLFGAIQHYLMEKAM